MIKYLPLLLGLLALLSCEKTQSIADHSGHIEYYSTLVFVETPLSELQGSVPLSKEVALTRNHYRFAYDEENRLTSISFYNRDQAVPPNHTANLFMLAHRTEFAYSKNEVGVSFFDEEKNPKTVLGKCATFVYTLNDFGYRTRLHFKDIGGNFITNAWGIHHYEWAYQPDGSVIENRFDESGNQVSIRPSFEFYRLRLRFNTLGHIAFMQQIDSEGNLYENETGAAQDQITTNSEGNFLQWQVLDKLGNPENGNGPNVAKGVQTFTKWGYESSLAHFDEHNQPMCSEYGICQSKTTFDEVGNMSSRAFYDEQGNPSLHSHAGYHSFIINYDERLQNRTSLQYFDENGNKTHHKTRGYHQAKYYYTGNRIKMIEYLNAAGNQVNRTDNGVASIIYSYKGGERTTKRFDMNGAELK